MKINYIRAISYFGGGLVYGYFMGAIVDLVLGPYGKFAVAVGITLSVGLMLLAMNDMPPIIEPTNVPPPPPTSGVADGQGDE